MNLDRAESTLRYARDLIWGTDDEEFGRAVVERAQFADWTPAVGIERVDDEWTIAVVMIQSRLEPPEVGPDQDVERLTRVLRRELDEPVRFDVIGPLVSQCKPSAIVSPAQGTVCCLVEHPVRARELLTCNHVIADFDRRPLGSPVSAVDPAGSVVSGQLTHFLKLSSPGESGFDVALWRASDMHSFENSMEGDTTQPVSSSLLGDDVELCGVVSRSRGQILTRRLGPVQVDNTHLHHEVTVLREVTMVAPVDSGRFSEPGDSGGLVSAVDPTGQRVPVGMLVAGTPPGPPPRSIFSELVDIMGRADLTFICA